MQNPHCEQKRKKDFGSRSSSSVSSARPSVPWAHGLRVPPLFSGARPHRPAPDLPPAMIDRWTQRRNKAPIPRFLLCHPSMSFNHCRKLTLVRSTPFKATPSGCSSRSTRGIKPSNTSPESLEVPWKHTGKMLPLILRDCEFRICSFGVCIYAISYNVIYTYIYIHTYASIIMCIYYIICRSFEPLSLQVHIFLQAV